MAAGNLDYAGQILSAVCDHHPRSDVSSDFGTIRTYRRVLMRELLV